MIRLPSLLFDIANRVRPADREVWFSAMRTELEFIPAAQRLRFASGCLAAAVVWRVWTPHGVRRLTTGGLIAASASLAGLAMVYALLGIVGPFDPLMTGLGFAYAAGAAATARWGLRGMVFFALSGIAINTVLMTAGAGGIAEAPELVRALSLEAFLILATFLGIAASADGLADRLERRA